MASMLEIVIVMVPFLVGIIPFYFGITIIDNIQRDIHQGNLDSAYRFDIKFVLALLLELSTIVIFLLLGRFLMPLIFPVTPQKIQPLILGGPVLLFGIFIFWSIHEYMKSRSQISSNSM